MLRTRLFFGLLPLLLAIVMAELSEGAIDAKAVALLGILAACFAALRVASPGINGFEPEWFLLILSARVFGFSSFAILLPQALVNLDGNIDGLHDFIGPGAEAAAPHFLTLSAARLVVGGRRVRSRLLSVFRVGMIGHE